MNQNIPSIAARQHTGLQSRVNERTTFMSDDLQVRPYIGTTSAAAILGVSETVVKKLAKRGDIPGAYREGKQWFLPRAEVEKLAKQRRKETA